MSKEQQAQEKAAPMTIEQAFNNVVLACRKYVGIADEHEALQYSLKMIKEALDSHLAEKKPEPELVK